MTYKWMPLMARKYCDSVRDLAARIEELRDGVPLEFMRSDVGALLLSDGLLGIVKTLREVTDDYEASFPTRPISEEQKAKEKRELDDRYLAESERSSRG